MSQEEKDQIDNSLKDELKKQIAAELKEEIKKELMESMKGQKVKEISEPELKETSSVISSTNRVLLPKGILKALGWKKGDVIDFKVEDGRIIGEKVGHSTISASKIKTRREKKTSEEDKNEIATGMTIQVSKYFAYEIAEKKASKKLQQVLENAYKLYDSKNFADGMKLLEMIKSIELKEEEPNRSKMRIAVINFLADILLKYPATIPKQIDEIHEIIQKINSRFLRENAYYTIGKLCKETKHWQFLDDILEILFKALRQYTQTELYAIMDLVEKIVELVENTESGYVNKIIEYIREEVSSMSDHDYKIRCLNYLTRLNAFKEVKNIGKIIKEDTLDGSSERRTLLDALKENREKEKAYLEKHPDYIIEEIDDDETESEDKKGSKKRKKSGKNDKVETKKEHEKDVDHEKDEQEPDKEKGKSKENENDDNKDMIKKEEETVDEEETPDDEEKLEDTTDDELLEELKEAWSEDE
ncbi:MAG: AbrB/MazE/SpoVT family DNA-binding domain-containing protein [Promethearchaeota archaeon]